MAKIIYIHEVTYRMSDGRLMLINEKNLKQISIQMQIEAQKQTYKQRNRINPSERKGAF